MIYFNFNLSNPFSDRWANVCDKSWLLGKHKGAEVQVVKDNNVINIAFRFTTRTDHAGAVLELGLLGYSIYLQYYDTRHWDDEKGRYYIYDSAGKAH